MPVLDAFPNYSISKRLILEIIISILKNDKRSISSDAIRAISGVHPPIKVIGEINIPNKGPGLVTLNHYSRPGFSIVWAALGISTQLPEEHLWMMTSAWTNHTWGIDQLSTNLQYKLEPERKLRDLALSAQNWIKNFSESTSDLMVEGISQLKSHLVSMGQCEP